MKSKVILTRDNKPTKELRETVQQIYKNIELSYEEVYYLDDEVDEETGTINKGKKAKYYTKEQVNRNMKALKNAYLIAKGSINPTDIIKFRNKYNIPASTLSVILGFSKNTISNIENSGVSSLTSGRLINMCLNNKEIMYHYIQVCDALEENKKEELSTKFIA